MVVLKIILTLLFAVFWLSALTGHAVILKVLQTPADRGRLGLPQSHLTLVWLLLLSTTSANLLALLLAAPFASLFAIFKTWPFGLPACKLSPFLKVASVTVNSYSLLGLMVVCYELVIKTGRPPPSTLKSYALVVSIWALALVTAAPMFTAHHLETITHVLFQFDEGTLYVPEEYVHRFLFNKSGDGSPGETTIQHNGTVHMQTFCTMPRRVELLSANLYLLVQFVVPVAITVYLYIKVADAVNSKKKATENSNNNNNNNSETAPQMPDNEVKFVRMILITSLVFHLLWAPRNINNFFFFFDARLLIVWLVCVLLSQSTHFIMPFLYLALNTNFQSALKTALGKQAPTEDTEEGNSSNSNSQIGFSRMKNEEVLIQADKNAF
ncbi:7 transmembrane receptor (rhodopsin) [Tyrophagus putrescentiae]|nr:7 transmembrane receptor (rhodopsin) [Tyrophagus putrescentiae]